MYDDNPFYILYILSTATMYVPVSDPKSSIAAMKGIAIFTVGPLLATAVYVILNWTVLSNHSSVLHTLAGVRLYIQYQGCLKEHGCFRSHDLRWSV